MNTESTQTLQMCFGMVGIVGTPESALPHDAGLWLNGAKKGNKKYGAKTASFQTLHSFTSIQL